MELDQPKNDFTADGRRIVYPIWRDDLAEALILQKADFVQEGETVDWNEVTKALVDKTGWKSSQPLIVSLKKS